MTCHTAFAPSSLAAITAEDIAELIAFAVTRPRRMTLDEVLVRPTAQP